METPNGDFYSYIYDLKAGQKLRLRYSNSTNIPFNATFTIYGNTDPTDKSLSDADLDNLTDQKYAAIIRSVRAARNGTAQSGQPPVQAVLSGPPNNGNYPSVGSAGQGGNSPVKPGHSLRSTPEPEPQTSGD